MLIQIPPSRIPGIAMRFLYIMKPTAATPISATGTTIATTMIIRLPPDEAGGGVVVPGGLGGGEEGGGGGAGGGVVYYANAVLPASTAEPKSMAPPLPVPREESAKRGSLGSTSTPNPVGWAD